MTLPYFFLKVAFPIVGPQKLAGCYPSSSACASPLRMTSSLYPAPPDGVRMSDARVLVVGADPRSRTTRTPRRHERVTPRSSPLRSASVSSDSSVASTPRRGRIEKSIPKCVLVTVQCEVMPNTAAASPGAGQRIVDGDPVANGEHALDDGDAHTSAFLTVTASAFRRPSPDELALQQQFASEEDYWDAIYEQRCAANREAERKAAFARRLLQSSRSRQASISARGAASTDNKRDRHPRSTPVSSRVGAPPSVSPRVSVPFGEWGAFSAAQHQNPPPVRPDRLRRLLALAAGAAALDPPPANIGDSIEAAPRPPNRDLCALGVSRRLCFVQKHPPSTCAPSHGEPQGQGTPGVAPLSAVGLPIASSPKQGHTAMGHERFTEGRDPERRRDPGHAQQRGNQTHDQKGASTGCCSVQ